VDRVEESGEDLATDLRGETYRTRTRGWRHQPEARPAGEGVYAIVHHGDHTHLAYELELPHGPGRVQEELGIVPEASYIIAVKNPEAPSPDMAPASDGPELPSALREHFGGRRFIPADPPELLDVEGFEFVLIGAAEDVGDELGIDLEPEQETTASADILRSLMPTTRHPVAPLTEGMWQ
jgi:hypothetical protein